MASREDRLIFRSEVIEGGGLGSRWPWSSSTLLWTTDGDVAGAADTVQQCPKPGSEGVLPAHESRWGIELVFAWDGIRV